MKARIMMTFYKVLSIYYDYKSYFYVLKGDNKLQSDMCDGRIHVYV